MKFKLLTIFFSLVLTGCGSFIKEGTYEKGYLPSVMDKNDLKKNTEGEGYTFSSGDFYKKHGKSITSSDANATMQISYVDSGDETKPAVLFVHGTPGDWTSFAFYLAITELKKNAHLVAVDRPGWGRSTCKTTAGKDCFYPLLKPQSKYLGSLLKNLDEQNNHQGVILVGWSLGAPLIGQMAFDYPELIKGVIFIAGPFDPELSHPRWYNRLSTMFAWIVPKQLDRSNDEMLLLSKQLEEMKSSWASINAPIWVIQGSIDDLVDRKNLDYARKMFAGKNAQFIEVETSGHFVAFERARVVVESITQALENLKPETTDTDVGTQ